MWQCFVVYVSGYVQTAYADWDLNSIADDQRFIFLLANDRADRYIMVNLDKVLRIEFKLIDVKV